MGTNQIMGSWDDGVSKRSLYMGQDRIVLAHSVICGTSAGVFHEGGQATRYPLKTRQPGARLNCTLRDRYVYQIDCEA